MRETPTGMDTSVAQLVAIIGRLPGISESEGVMEGRSLNDSYRVSFRVEHTEEAFASLEAVEEGVRLGATEAGLPDAFRLSARGPQEAESFVFVLEVSRWLAPGLVARQVAESFAGEQPPLVAFRPWSGE